MAYQIIVQNFIQGKVCPDSSRRPSHMLYFIKVFPILFVRKTGVLHIHELAFKKCDWELLKLEKGTD